jgi:hypothetical protein
MMQKNQMRNIMAYTTERRKKALATFIEAMAPSFSDSIEEFTTSCSSLAGKQSCALYLTYDTVI